MNPANPLVGGAAPGNSLGLLPAGRRLGRHQILRLIASGGMASVYLGRAIGDAGFERVVAIKCCHPHLRGNHEFATMFLDEARLSARIHHPNVVAVLDVSAGDPLYLVMEYIEGDRISALIDAALDAGSEVPQGIALRVLVDALSGLQAAHELTDADGRPLHIVHRDVSPQNILVGVDGTTRIADFGIAKAEMRATITVAGQRKGKVAYMAPEQVRALPVTPRSDVFSAGIVLWETLAGQRLFKAASESEMGAAVLESVIPRLSSVRAGIPPALDRAVMKALDRDPQRRFASALEFATALETCGVPVASTRVVREWVLRSLATQLAERRELLRLLVATPISATENDFVTDGTTVFTGAPAGMERLYSGQTDRDEVPSDRSTSDLKVPPGGRPEVTESLPGVRAPVGRPARASDIAVSKRPAASAHDDQGGLEENVATRFLPIAGHAAVTAVLRETHARPRDRSVRPRAFSIAAALVVAAVIAGFGLVRMAKNSSSRAASASERAPEPVAPAPVPIVERAEVPSAIPITAPVEAPPADPVVAAPATETTPPRELRGARENPAASTSRGARTDPPSRSSNVRGENGNASAPASADSRRRMYRPRGL